MAIIPIDLADDKAYIAEHIEVAEKLTRKAAEARSLQARLTEKQEIRDRVGDRVRAGLVRQNPAAAAIMEAQLTDMAVERDGAGEVIRLHTNADAESYRVNL